LKDICLICLQTKIGQLYTTPWKSLIVKGIGQDDRSLWDYALGKYRINVRHASNELNWQVEDLSGEGLRLKRYLVRQFDNDGIRTYGLCFAVKTRPRTGLFGSVIIRKQINKHPNRSKLLDRYDILHTRDFNANSKDYILYREGVEKENLGAYLVSLCRYFYELQSGKDLIPGRPWLQDAAPLQGKPEKKWVFQCRHCLTLYDEQYGDPAGGAPPGLKFEETGPDYECSVCGAPKDDLTPVEKSLLIH
jgi:rubredoxin